MEIVARRVGYIFILCLLVGVLLVGAQEVYKQSTNVDLKVACLDFDDSLCNGNNCTINIFYANETFLVNNASMSQDAEGLLFNYTLNTTQTGSSDDYKTLVACFNGSAYAIESFEFSITPNGQRTNLAGAIIQFGLLAVLFVFLGIMIFVYYNLDEQPTLFNLGGREKMFNMNAKPAMKVGLLLGSYVMIVLILGMSWLLSSSYLSVDIFSTILRNLFLTSLYGVVPVVFLAGAWLLIGILQHKEMQKLYKRGLLKNGRGR